VGPGADSPWLVWRPAAPVTAIAVRAVVTGGSGVRVGEVHALVQEERS
jgi:hypothetical protein